MVRSLGPALQSTPDLPRGEPQVEPPNDPPVRNSFAEWPWTLFTLSANFNSFSDTWCATGTDRFKRCDEDRVHPIGPRLLPGQYHRPLSLLERGHARTRARALRPPSADEQLAECESTPGAASQPTSESSGVFDRLPAPRGSKHQQKNTAERSCLRPSTVARLRRPQQAAPAPTVRKLKRWP